eukprot:2434981-Pyramimonas_sp.AAC.1
MFPRLPPLFTPQPDLTQFQSQPRLRRRKGQDDDDDDDNEEVEGEDEDDGHDQKDLPDGPVKPAR